jgi:hypothetical protein
VPFQAAPFCERLGNKIVNHPNNLNFDSVIRSNVQWFLPFPTTLTCNPVGQSDCKIPAIYEFGIRPLNAPIISYTYPEAQIFLKTCSNTDFLDRKGSLVKRISASKSSFVLRILIVYRISAFHRNAMPASKTPAQTQPIPATGWLPS